MLFDVNVAKNAQYVEDNHLAFGEYKAEAQLKQIQHKKALLQKRADRKMKRQYAEYARNMRHARRKALKENQKKQLIIKKLNEQQARKHLAATREPMVVRNPENLMGNPFAGFSKGEEYLDRNHFLGFNPLDVAKDLLNVALAPITHTTKIIVRTAQTGSPKQAYEEVKQDIKDQFMLVRNDMMPVTETIVKGAGIVWESKVGKITSKIIFNKYTDPGYKGSIVNRLHPNAILYKTSPYYRKNYDKAYGTIDRYSGGTLTSFESAASVPGKLGRREPVTKAELINAAIVALKVGAIVASGGSAAVVIGMLAGQMKQGPLGATKEGRTLLTLAEIAAIAYTAGASGAASGAGAAGSQAASQTAASAAAQAVEYKAQQMAAEKAATIIAKETGTGVLGEIAVSATLGPGTYQQALTKAAQEKGMEVVAKEVGPEAVMLASAVVAASSVASQMSKYSGKTPEQLFSDELKKQLEEKVKAEAMKKVEETVRKQIGEPGASIAIAAIKGESFEQIAKKQLTDQERKLLGKEFTNQEKLIESLSKARALDLSKIQMSTPEERTLILNSAVEKEMQIKVAEGKRNEIGHQLDIAPIQAQKALTDNALTIGTPIAKIPNPSLSVAERTKNADTIEAAEAKVLEELEYVYYDTCVEVNNLVGQLKMLGEESSALIVAEKFAEAALIEAQMAILNDRLEKAEAKALAYAQAIELQKAKGAVKVAAAEEGRYIPYINHPLAGVMGA